MSSDIVIDQSGTFTITFTWDDGATPPNPIDLTGYNVEFRIFADYGSEDQRTLLTVKTGSGSTPGTSITLGGAAGTIAIRIEQSVLAGLVFYSGWYTLLGTAPDAITETPIAAGTATLVKGVAY